MRVSPWFALVGYMASFLVFLPQRYGTPLFTKWLIAQAIGLCVILALISALNYFISRNNR